MCGSTGTNLEDEDVLAKNVMDIDGRTVRSLNSCWYHSHVPRMVCRVAGITAEPSAVTIPSSYLGPHIAVGMDASHSGPSLHVVMQPCYTGASLHVVMQLCYTGVHAQYYEYESYAPYGTNGSHQISRATTKVVTSVQMLNG